MQRMNLEELHELARSGDFESALAAVGEVEGPLEHRVTLEEMNDAVRFAARCGDLSTAVELGAYVHERRAAVLGRGHRKTLTSFANLLRYKASVGETVDFETVHVLTCDWMGIDPQCEDPAHLDAWALTAELAQNSESAVCCVARFEQVLGHEHPNTARARDKLARLLPPHQLPTV